MRTLVTGGAGFIGTHLVGELLERGDEVVVLDSLEEQVHGGQQPALPRDVEFIHGDCGDPEACDRALAGADRVAHLAAIVGVGQSMYEIARYTRGNTMATAVLLERLIAMRELPQRLVVASSMSIYGEGEYSCPEHGRIAPPPRPEAQLLLHEWEAACPHCGHVLTPVGTSESKPLIPTSIYAINKRDHEEMCLVTGAAYGIPATALSHIFEEFRQVDSRLSRRHGGAGLGLAIARRLAEQMGGRITISSEPNVGSTFTLHLPGVRP
ncbi:MAG: NAD-dependent epimerase/dehydratase family protein [Actinobacteria bacterium]|nr:NAD-dependent epimerase/dehydratase family protein [Actinomycetota bacterium]